MRKCPSCKKALAVRILHWLFLLNVPRGARVACLDCGYTWDDWDAEVVN